MDVNVKFPWKRFPSRAQPEKVAFQAIVPTTAFDLECNVYPTGETYNWSIHPHVGTSKWIWGVRVCSLRAHHEAAAAIADLERVLRLEIANCLAGQKSVFDAWRDALAIKLNERFNASPEGHLSEAELKARAELRQTKR